MDNNKRSNELKKCFVMMPFKNHFNRYYQDIFIPAIKNSGLVPIRADEINKPGVIINQIWEGIKQSHLCLAEVTGLNPNVMYELGLAHAINKPVVLVVQNSAKDIPFDLRALRHIVYDTSTTTWVEDLKKNIEKMIREVINAPSDSLAFIEKNSEKEKNNERKESTNAAIIMVIGPEEAARHMKIILADAIHYSKSLNDEELYDKILALAEREISFVKNNLEDSTMSPEERNLEKNMVKVIEGRIRNLLTDFRLEYMQEQKNTLEVFKRAFETWAKEPDWSQIHRKH